VQAVKDLEGGANGRQSPSTGDVPTSAVHRPTCRVRKARRYSIHHKRRGWSSRAARGRANVEAPAANKTLSRPCLFPTAQSRSPAFPILEACSQVRLSRRPKQRHPVIYLHRLLLCLRSNILFASLSAASASLSASVRSGDA
jgi:hypothetical protein